MNPRLQNDELDGGEKEMTSLMLGLQLLTPKATRLRLKQGEIMRNPYLRNGEIFRNPLESNTTILVKNVEASSGTNPMNPCPLPCILISL